MLCHYTFAANSVLWKFIELAHGFSLVWLKYCFHTSAWRYILRFFKILRNFKLLFNFLVDWTYYIPNLISYHFNIWFASLIRDSFDFFIKILLRLKFLHFGSFSWLLRYQLLSYRCHQFMSWPFTRTLGCINDAWVLHALLHLIPSMLILDNVFISYHSFLESVSKCFIHDFWYLTLSILHGWSSFIRNLFLHVNILICSGAKLIRLYHHKFWV